jgi:alpha-ribazole phosphatase
MKVTFIRHTTPDVPKGTCYGQTDVALKDTFEAEAAVTAKNLEGMKFDKVYTSPLTRCVRLATYCGYPDAERNDRLKEMNFGDWEMIPLNELKHPTVEEFYKNYLTIKVPGGESFPMVYARVAAFLDGLKKKGYQSVAIFSHGGVLRCAEIYGGKIEMKHAIEYITPFGGIIQIDI